MLGTVEQMASGVKDRARADAKRILRTAWQVDPKVPLPVDPVRIANRLGIEVFDESLDDDISGAIVKNSGRDPVILLNAADSQNRKRFTCAHEIGHFVERPQEEQYEFVDLRGALASEGVDPHEIYANEFAACLLMPEDEVRAMKKSGDIPAQMAAKFRVSSDAMTYRLKNLDLLFG